MTQCITFLETNSVSVDTKIAFSFFDLGRAYEERNRFDLAIENYKKSLDYDPDLYFVKLTLENLISRLKNNSGLAKTVQGLVRYGQRLEAAIS